MSSFLIFFCLLIFLFLFISLAFKFNLLFLKKTLNESRFSAVEIEKILNKVRNAEPLVYTNKIDKKRLESAGISLDKPVFIERAELLTLQNAKNLWLAKQIYNFNLIIFYNTEQNIKRLKTFFDTEAKFLSISDIAKPLKENLLKLNINHNELLRLNVKAENTMQVKGNFKKSTYFKNFCLEKKFENKNLNLNIKHTFFKGQFFFINATFYNLKTLKINFSRTLKLKQFDYLTLHKEKNCFEIKSLINDFKYYLYSPEKIKNAQLIKIKNSNNYNLKCEVDLKNKTQTQNFFWLYVGSNQLNEILNLNSEDLKTLKTEYIFSQVFNKIQSQFNLKINSASSILNYYFNKHLPEKIILEGIKNDGQMLNNISVENIKLKSIFDNNNCLKNTSFKGLIQMHKSKQLPAVIVYKIMKDKFLLQQNNFLHINKTELKNYELRLFFENKIKSIFVKSDAQKKLIVGNISYYNCQNISLKTLKDYDNFEVKV